MYLGEPEVSEAEIGIHLKGGPVVFESLIVIADKIKHTSQVRPYHNGKWIQGKRPLLLLQAVRMAAQHT